MIDSNGNLLIAKSDKDLFLVPKMSNRHGLVAGATGTGKTVTLQTLAETFSSIGVPVIMADVKGDLSGIAKPAGENPKVAARLQELNLQGYSPQGFPVCFWDIYGEQGHPLRTTISEMGPLLLSRLLNLNEVQAGVLTLVFKIADDSDLLLLDLKDLRKILEFVGEHRDEYTNEYGNISSASIGTIQRGLLTLEEQGADNFFGEPALDIMDFIQTDAKGKGVMNILAADKLMLSPGLYSTFLLWLLSELFEQLPEVGDLDKPKLVFFFDEAHLLFQDAPKMLEERIVQVVRLIRSKGIGVYFVTQNPLDLPDPVLGQLGNRVQHALHGGKRHPCPQRLGWNALRKGEERGDRAGLQQVQNAAGKREFDILRRAVVLARGRDQGRLDGVDEHFLCALERALLPTIDGVVLPLFHPCVIKIAVAFVRHRHVGLLDATLDFFEQSILEPLRVTHHGIQVGVLGLEVGEHLGILPFAEPVVAVRADIAVLLKRCRPDLRFWRNR